MKLNFENAPELKKTINIELAMKQGIDCQTITHRREEYSFNDMPERYVERDEQKVLELDDWERINVQQ